MLTGALAPSSHAQLRQTTATFLDHHPQPRVHALGHATVALEGYQGAIDVNPASVGKPGALHAGTNVSATPLLASDWLPVLFDDYWIAAPSVSVRVGRLGVAAQVKYVRNTDEVVTPRGIVAETSKQIEWAARVAGAYEIPPLTVGAGIGIIHQRLPDVGEEGKLTSTVPALDLGLRYERSYGFSRATVRPMLGWSLTNLGPTVDFEDEIRGDLALPMKMRLGGAVDVASRFFPQDRPLLRLVLAGALAKPLTNFEPKTGTFDSGRKFTYLDADGPLKALFSSGWESKPGAVTRNGQAPQVSVWEQTTRHLGAELRVQEILSLQWGRFHEHERAGNRQFTTLGFGVDLYYVTLQHAWTVGDGPQDNSFWRLTGRIPLTNSAPPSWFPLGE